MPAAAALSPPARRLLALAALLPAAALASPPEPKDVAAWDDGLCTLAQRMLVDVDGPGAPPFRLEVLQGVSNGFHTIQMDVDAATRTVTLAETSGTVRADGAELATHVACKLVDRDRVNDVLGLDLAGPARSCRDVNELTWRTALDGLTADERRRYETAGRPLRFGDDLPFATGAEWLPAPVERGIRAVPGAGAGDPGYLEVRAPAVIVPWNRAERQFFQGTHHCKLVTLAAMRRWMLQGALARDDVLFPPGKAACDAPASLTSVVGSCTFWFAPAGARFCQDYSGPGWTADAARAECGKRHASAEALRAAANKYAGAGGDFSTASCAEREGQKPSGGTCVFHCRQPDETLWRALDAPAGGAAGAASDAMMSRACDLFLP